MIVTDTEQTTIMDSPSNSYPKVGRGARCDDVTSLDSWCELDQSSPPVTQKQSKSPDDQISSHTKSRHQKQKKKTESSSNDTSKSKTSVANSRSSLSTANSSGSSSNASISGLSRVKLRDNADTHTTSTNAKEAHFNLKSDMGQSSAADHESRYSSNNPLTLNPSNLQSLVSDPDLNYYKHSNNSHSLPFSPSYENAGPSQNVGTASGSNYSGHMLYVKPDFLQNRYKSNPGELDSDDDLCIENISNDERLLSVDGRKWADDKHRSSESIYSSTERSQNINKPRQGNDLIGDLDQLMEQSEKVKTKIMSVWNNMRYGWTIKTKTQFRFDSPIYLLGKCYHIRKEEDVETDIRQPLRHRPTHPNLSYRMTEMEAFKRDFTSRLWFTYRRDFPVLHGSSLTTDCGWGCMLRSAQMMLAQAFCDHFLSRDWRLFNVQTKEQELYHKQIIRWFGDFPSDQSPFSIHSLVQLGAKSGKRPGDWYGPSSVAHIFKDAIVKAYEYQPILNDMAIYVSQDCTDSSHPVDLHKYGTEEAPQVYKQDILDLCSNRRRSSARLSSSTDSPVSPVSSPGFEQEWRRGVVILIPVRLGSDVLNPVYVPCLKSLLTQDCCLGIIGGKPRHSLYFIGWQEDKLIHLDPHYCQDVVDIKARDFPDSTYHCMSPRKMSFTKMDPSCTIGFYCKTKADFNKFIEQTEEMVLEPKYKGLYPMFIFSEGSSGDVSLEGLSVKEDRMLRVRHIKSKSSNGKQRSRTVESEEFVFL